MPRNAYTEWTVDHILASDSLRAVIKSFIEDGLSPEGLYSRLTALEEVAIDRLLLERSEIAQSFRMPRRRLVLLDQKASSQKEGAE